MSGKLPIVVYWFRGASQETVNREMGFGYLVKRDGHYWCIPNEEDSGLQIFPSDAFQLDQSQLQEQTNRGFDRKLYRSFREVEIGPPRTQMPQPPSAGIQGRVL